VLGRFQKASCVTYTVHGDDNKARISIMFAQEDSKHTPRKLKSTVRRNNKRMKEYNENMKDSKTEYNDKSRVENNENKENVDIHNESTGMDVDVKIAQLKNTEINENQHWKNTSNCEKENT